MPLNKSKSKEAFQKNIKTEIAAGTPQKQESGLMTALKGGK